MGEKSRTEKCGTRLNRSRVRDRRNVKPNKLMNVGPFARGSL